MVFKRIFLVGFMCSGKTTLGRMLSDRLGWTFLDVDEEIQKLENMSIPEIFERKGEVYFRRLELDLLSNLSEGEEVIISTGGGLGANQKAMDLMKSKGLVIWLKIDFETFLKRCGGDTSRPLLKKNKEELFKLFEDRSKVYSQSHLILDGSLDPKELVREILSTCGID